MGRNRGLSRESKKSGSVSHMGRILPLWSVLGTLSSVLAVAADPVAPVKVQHTAAKPAPSAKLPTASPATPLPPSSPPVPHEGFSLPVPFETCDADCFDLTCDYWVDNPSTCVSVDGLESVQCTFDLLESVYGCECGGCCCKAGGGHSPSWTLRRCSCSSSEARWSASSCIVGAGRISYWCGRSCIWRHSS